MQEERELIAKVRKGDREAYGELYDKYAAALFRYISFRINHPQDVEDLLSGVFLKAFETLLEGKTVYQVRAFLYQAARNAIVDYFRNKTRQQEFELQFDINERGEEFAENAEKLAIDTHIDIERVKASLREIKIEYQEVIILRYIEELEIKEIAVALNKSHVGVRVLLHRALQALKGHLEENAI